GRGSRAGRPPTPGWGSSRRRGRSSRWRSPRTARTRARTSTPCTWSTSRDGRPAGRGPRQALAGVVISGGRGGRSPFTRSPISIGRPRGSASAASSSGMNRTRDRRAEVPRSTHDRRRGMPRPSPAEYAPYYGQYVELVPEDDVLAALQAQLDDVLALLRAVPEAQGTVRHPPYTWSVKEVVGHMTDT